MVTPNKRIVKKIGKLVFLGYSDAYIQASAWLMRDSETSMKDIQLMINIFRIYFSKDEE